MTDSNIHSFLDGWLDNRVRAIFFTQKEALSARFLAPGFYYRENVAFGYVNTHDPEVRGALSKYNVNKYRETMLMFNEETNTPVATVSVSIIFIAKTYLCHVHVHVQQFFSSPWPNG